MYNESLTTVNKIITDKDLEEIFYKMYELIEINKKESELEKRRNEIYESAYQIWNLREFTGNLKFYVNFYDDTSITYDNYNAFIGIFNDRISEIRRINVNFRISYSKKTPNSSNQMISHYIDIDINETRFNLNVSQNSADKKIEEIFELIKQKVYSAPLKYDKIIKQKSSIIFKVGLSLGLIPSIVIMTLLLFVPTIRETFASSYILYPLCCVFLGLILGNTIFTGGVPDDYESIIRDKKYGYYDDSKRKSVYKDDIEKFSTTSEIIIGKNSDNLKCRQDIKEKADKYPKWIPFELIAILVMSIIVTFL